MMRKTGHIPINLNNTITALLLILVTLSGAFLRFYNLTSASLWIDEGFSLVHARAILSHGYPLIQNSVVSWDYFPVHYLMALGLLMTQSLELGGRLFPALAGVLLIPATFMLSKRVFRSVPAAIIAAILMASCTYEVAWSRQARSYICLQLFSTVAITYFYAFLDTRQKSKLIVAMLGMFLSITTHRAGYLVPAIFGIAILGELKNIKSWWLWICNQRYFVIMLIAISLSFLLSLGTLTTNSTLNTTIAQALTNSDMQYAPSYLWFLQQQLKWILPWIGLGIIIAIWKHAYRALPLIIIAGLYFYMLSYRNILFHFRYLLPIFPFIFIFAAYGASSIATVVTRSSGWMRKSITVIFICLFVASWCFSSFSFIPQSDYQLGYTAPQPNWNKAYNWIEDEEKNKKGNISTTSTFPMFHDLYFGNNNGSRYFLPYSMSGFPDAFELIPRYSQATVIPDLKTLKSMNTWIVLDDYGLRMLKDKETQDFLKRKRPIKTIRSSNKFNIFIWKLETKN